MALLSDRNGVIELDLPLSGSLSGSLNGPQFSIDPIVIKIIINVIVKASTAPFSLLAAAVGGSGGDRLSTVAFTTGSAVLEGNAKSRARQSCQSPDRPAQPETRCGWHQ